IRSSNGPALLDAGAKLDRLAREFQSRLDRQIPATPPAPFPDTSPYGGSPKEPGAESRASWLDRHDRRIIQQWMLVSCVEQGFSVREALARSQLTCTARTARNILRRYRENGVSGLGDGRTRRLHRAHKVMTAEVESLV